MFCVQFFVKQIYIVDEIYFDHKVYSSTADSITYVTDNLND